MRRIAILLVFPVLCLFSDYVSARTHDNVAWDASKPVNASTVFFGEPEPAESAEVSEPLAGDKGYGWHWLEKGNNFLLADRKQKAAVAFKNAYQAGGPTRVLSGFKLVESYEALGNVDQAIEVLQEMKKNYLVGSQEVGRAALVRARLEDQKRKISQQPPAPAFTGRVWLLQVSRVRLKYTLEAMEVLRRHEIPLNEPAQKYAFYLDEYFIANPEASAESGPNILAEVIYQTDPQARVPIDRWRMHPAEVAMSEKSFPQKEKKRFTGAEWLTMTHHDKMKYVLGAISALKSQQVPMQKSAYAYEYALDDAFSQKPELPASDSVVALASVLYETEPEAREVLEALRLQ